MHCSGSDSIAVAVYGLASAPPLIQQRSTIDTKPYRVVVTSHGSAVVVVATAVKQQWQVSPLLIQQVEMTCRGHLIEVWLQHQEEPPFSVAPGSPSPECPSGLAARHTNLLSSVLGVGGQQWYGVALTEDMVSARSPCRACSTKCSPRGMLEWQSGGVGCSRASEDALRDLFGGRSGFGSSSEASSAFTPRPPIFLTSIWTQSQKE